MAEDRYPYESWVNQALQGVLRRALRQLSTEGFTGDHHLFISFDTNHRDVRIPGFLRAQYPDEITIVLQHQFDDLVVTDEAFQVSLSFSGQKHRLAVPFVAVRSFADPSVNFGLQLNQGSQHLAQPAASPARSRIPASERPRELPSGLNGAPKPAPGNAQDAPKPRKAVGEAAPAENGAGAEVIALDTFRKK